MCVVLNARSLYLNCTSPVVNLFVYDEARNPTSKRTFLSIPDSHGDVKINTQTPLAFLSTAVQLTPQTQRSETAARVAYHSITNNTPPSAASLIDLPRPHLSDWRHQVAQICSGATDGVRSMLTRSWVTSTPPSTSETGSLLSSSTSTAPVMPRTRAL